MVGDARDSIWAFLKIQSQFSFEKGRQLHRMNYRLWDWSKKLCKRFSKSTSTGCSIPYQIIIVQRRGTPHRPQQKTESQRAKSSRKWQKYTCRSKIRAGKSLHHLQKYKTSKETRRIPATEKKTQPGRKIRSKQGNHSNHAVGHSPQEIH